MEINLDDAIGGYVTKIGEKIRETRDEFILESLMPYAQTVESRIDKESLSKAIRMYYDKDVQEVKHGKWKETVPTTPKSYRRICSVCCGVAYMIGKKYSYCPHCGAKMDLEEKENG